MYFPERVEQSEKWGRRVERKVAKRSKGAQGMMFTDGGPRAETQRRATRRATGSRPLENRGVARGSAGVVHRDVVAVEVEAHFRANF